MIPYFFLLCIRARSFTHFTACNPGIEDGGLAGESKSAILSLIPSQYIATSIFISKSESAEEAYDKLKSYNLSLPVILKPDVGERGREVERIDNRSQWNDYFQRYRNDKIVQEFIPFELELGIMYYRFPNQTKGCVSSVVQKEFLRVQGDGHSSLAQLVRENTRARFHIKRLEEKFKYEWHRILHKGEYFVLEGIGNHSRGTKFINANKLISENLSCVIDPIATQIPGFYYGRFDLRVPSWKDLLKGENIRILELNGISSEPAHIYDPEYSLFAAYRDLMNHWRTCSEIAQENIRRGVRPSAFRKLLQIIRQHITH